jgi:hypothetical protein
MIICQQNNKISKCSKSEQKVFYSNENRILKLRIPVAREPNVYSEILQLLKILHLHTIGTHINRVLSLPSLFLWNWGSNPSSSQIRPAQQALYTELQFPSPVTGAHSLAQTGLELMILITLPPTFWDYRCESSSLSSLSTFNMD